MSVRQFTERIKDGTEGVWRWVLLSGSRLLIAFALVVGFFLLLETLHAAGVTGYTDSSTISRMASGMTAGSFSLITIVLTINQLILSQELGTAGQVQSRLEGMLSFRERIESTAGVAAAPARPAEMIAVLARSTREAATALSASVAANPNDDLRSDVESYADGVEEASDDLLEGLPGSDSTFDTLLDTFDFDDQVHIHLGRRLRNGNADDLSEESLDRFDDLIELLKLFDVGRSHFETIYLRRELADLSRTILAVGIPALIAALLINLVYGTEPGTSLPTPILPIAVSALSAVVFAPVAVLASYLLRAATVGYNNATVGPMILGGEEGALPEEGGIDGTDGGSDRRSGE